MTIGKRFATAVLVAAGLWATASTAGAQAINPYAPVANPYGGNIYNPMGSYYDPYNNPYYGYGYDPFGGILRGQADVMRAYGTVITSQEQARIMRELAEQAKLDTRKRRFDLEMYIKANTPTFTEEQAKIAKMTLKRIQSNSTEPEIVNGTALNLLLDDMRKYPGKKASVDAVQLSEDMLLHLNVSRNSASLGILRNDGKFYWPVGLQELVSADQRKLIEAQAATLVKNAAAGGNVDVNIVKEMRAEMDKIRDNLVRLVNDMPTNQYLDAKRFLNDFDDARIALERGDAGSQLKYRHWATGGKSLQDLVDYMIQNGLRFGSAVMGDESAYRAVYSGMAALDVALNAQSGVYTPETPMPQNP
ncbi:MAG: hypothetical protein L0215_23860 [Gemmataceae bacterium]|nr:hypothetical protein [Gemmataceae bacterium]